MKVLIVKKDQFRIAAIRSWLLKNDNEVFEMPHTNISQAIATICPTRIILGFGLHPRGQIGFLNEILHYSLKVDVYFILTVPKINIRELVQCVSTEKVCAIIHYEDAESYFSNLCLDNSSDTYLSPRIKMAIGNIPCETHALHQLSECEMRVAALIVQNYDNKEIAERLFRSVFTIEDHRKHIKEKLECYGGKKVLLNTLYEYSLWIVNSCMTNSASVERIR